MACFAYQPDGFARCAIGGISFIQISAVSSRTNLFGVDLGPLGRDLVRAWLGMLNWPLLAWLWPRLAVRLLMPCGDIAYCQGLSFSPASDEKSLRLAATAKFEAIVLPENLLLRTHLVMPPLPDLELQAALSLQVQALSPVAVDDLVWVHERGIRDNQATLIDVTLSSRKRVAEYLLQVQSQLRTSSPEVWAKSAGGGSFIMLSGFGEARRQGQDRVWRWTSVTLVLIALGMLTALAVTPSVQLYLRYKYASRAMDTLQKKAVPVLLQRESLVRATDQLAVLSKLVGESVSPLQTLKLVTQALPDDTSLRSLQIQGLKVSLSGQTADAAALMKQLGSTPGLHNVTAPTPATKPLGAPLESFGIEFMLDAAPAKVTP